VLGHGRAAFDPIAAVDVAHRKALVDRRMVDVAADDAVDRMAVRFGAERLFKLADMAHGVLDLELGPSRQRPIRQAEPPAHGVEDGVDDERHPVGVVAQQGDPARVLDDHVEMIAVNHEVAPAVDADVKRRLDDFDAAEMRAVIVAQELVVIARHVDHARALARLAQQLLHYVVVGLRPVPSAAQLPAVDDVADQIDGVGVVQAEKIEQPLSLAPSRSQMNVRQEQRAKSPRNGRHDAMILASALMVYASS
jgi:hypothetical protein